MITDVTVGKFGAFYVNPGSNGDGLDPKDKASLTPFTTKYHETTPIMQFTGLKDKNGKEIYEGDVVQRMADRYDFDKPEGEDYWKEREVSHIVYRKSGFWVESESFGWEGEGLWDWREMEVIGNIYEHKNLLIP